MRIIVVTIIMVIMTRIRRIVIMVTIEITVMRIPGDLLAKRSVLLDEEQDVPDPDWIVGRLSPVHASWQTHAFVRIQILDLNHGALMAA